MIKKLILILLIIIISTPVFGATWYISPTGDDEANGQTDSTPWATLTYAYTQMSGGDTLVFINGTYDMQLFPPVALSGSEGNPTIFRAQNSGYAIIAPSSLDTTYGVSGSIFVWSNTSRGRMGYFDFEGLFAIGYGEHNAIGVFSMDYADPDTEMTHHINFRECGARGSAKDVNVSAPVEIMGSTDILFEDGYAFGYGRKAMEVYGARNVTVRRLVVRHDWWEGDSYLPNDPRVQVTCYNTVYSTFENIIALDAGPHPAVRSPDRAGLVLSGNAADGTSIAGSDHSGYYGCIVLNNQPASGYFNGIEINGGSGDPATNLTVQDVVIIDSSGYGLNVHDNVDGVTISYVSSISNGLIGFRENPSPSYSINNVTYSYLVSKDNTSYGFYNLTPTNSSATGNSDADVEAARMPTISWVPTNTPAESYERGADVTKRYVDGTKTSTDLWPWPNEDIIKSRMCDETFLADVETTIETYDSSSITYNPGLCASGKTLTTYIWEYLGNEIPSDVYGETPSSSYGGGTGGWQ